MSIKVMTHVWQHSQQESNALVLMLAIADMANDNGDAYPGVAHLRQKVRLKTDRAVQYLMRKCEAAGELRVYPNAGIDTGHGRTNLYRVVMPGVNDQLPVPKTRRNGVKKRSSQPQGVNAHSPQGVNAHSPQGVNAHSPKTSVETSVETSVVPSPNGDGVDTTWQAILEATKTALNIETYPSATKIAQFLAGRVPERDSKNHSNGDWFTLQLTAGMDAREISAFGMWLADGDIPLLRKPLTIQENAAKFRKDDDHALYLSRVDAARRAAIALAARPAVDSDIDEDGAEDHRADVARVLAETQRALVKEIDV